MIFDFDFLGTIASLVKSLREKKYQFKYLCWGVTVEGTVLNILKTPIGE